ncbi:MAG: DUF1501 domain-containing protein [Vicinamibacterales bacterium]
MTSRRVFLKSGAMAMVSLGFAPGFVGRAAAQAGGRGKLLIAVFQRGAVDGLNMVVPYGEAEYYRLRPAIAVPRPAAADGGLDLDGFFALHPRMAPLKPAWDGGSLAVVHACGSPDHTRSHFDAQDYMESATPGVKSTRDGWLNRYLHVVADLRGGRLQPGHSSPLRGVAATRQMPRALHGPAAAISLGSLEEFAVRASRRVEQSLETAWTNADDPRFADAGRDAFEAMRVLREAATAVPPADTGYPRSPFGRALQEIARLARADVGLEVAFAEATNWDHHANEGGATGQLANRLDDFSAALAALVRDLGDRMADTVIVTMSEFGRTVAQNGTRGTDHGHGNAVLVLGGPVRGGRVYGRWPGLAPDQRHDGRDLAITTDFRQVFGELLSGHMGVSGPGLDRIFPGFAHGERLGLVR